jgi:hypothetical protein
MSESGMWTDHVKDALFGLHPTRIENRWEGTPDVNYIEGWIELKFIRDLPKRAATIVRIDHFTPQQRVWLLERSLAGGKVFLLLKLASSWMIFEGRVASEFVGLVDYATLKEKAIQVWDKTLNKTEFRKIIRST